MYATIRTSSARFTTLGLLIWFLTALFFLYEFFLRTILNSLVYELIYSLKITVEQLSLIDVAYCIAYGAMQIPVGILTDRFGVKRVLTVAILLCSAGVLLFSHAHGFYSAFFSRILMGAGSSFAFICLLVITLNWLPKKAHGTFFGFAQLIGAIGPLLAGAPTIILLHNMHDNWRLALLLVSCVGFLLLFLTLFFVRDNPKLKETKLDINSKESLKKSLSYFIKNKRVWLLVLYSASIYVSLALLGTLWGTTYLEARGINAVQAALIVSMLWFGLAFGCPVLGAISDLFKCRKTTMLFAAILGILVSLIIIYLPDCNNITILALAFFCLGIASAGQSVAFVAIAETVESNMRATALGLNNAGISFAIAIVMLTIGYLIQRSTGINVQAFHQADFKLGLLIMPAMYMVGLWSCVFMQISYSDKVQK
jgi:MFS family permease